MSDEQVPLLGRAPELEELGTLLGAVRNALGHAWRLSGEPGIGKTALLDAAVRRAAGFQVVRADGYEVERDLSYAGVQRVLAQLDSDRHDLPAREREALDVAVRDHDGPVPDRFLVGRALLGLLAAAAAERPVLCVIDDAQWMDRESLDALGFAARRLHADAVLMLFASREDPEMDVHLGGVRVHRVPELDRGAAIELLTDRLGMSFDPRVAAGIVDAVGGNPLALTDLAADPGVRQSADSSFAPPGAGRRLEQHYRRQVRDLPAATQRWLLVAAAEATGELRLVDHAAGALGIAENAGETADSAGLVVIDGAVRFRHPLVRAAIYGAAAAADRRRVHAALARAAAQHGRHDAEAWHAGAAAARPDDRVADRLVAAAGRAARRGGLISGASLLGKAAELTADPGLRYERLLGAAESAAEAGAGRLALELLERTDDGANPDPVSAGRRLLLRASLAAFLLDTEGMPDAPAHLVAAADLFHGVDPQREGLALLRAFDAAQSSERLMRGTTVRDIGVRMRAAAAVDDGETGVVLAGLAALILDPYADAIAPMRAAVDVMATVEDARLLLFGTAGVALTTALWDERARDRHLDQSERVAVAGGALRALDSYLWIRSLTDVDRGDPVAAGRTIERVRETRRAMGYPAEHVVNSSYLAWIGEPCELVEQIAQATLAAGYAGVYTATLHALAVRDLAEGRYPDAFGKLTESRRHAILQVVARHLPEYVEAAVRSGHATEAAAAAGELVRRAESNRQPWAHGIAERCLALVDSTPEAERHYRAALDALTTTDTPGDLDRTHLLYGEWLRRHRRRSDARHHLHRARAGFVRAGMTAFAARAQRELAVLGDESLPDQSAVRSRLTVQESQVAMLAAAGRTNAEIAATMFLSASTVDYHLRKVFRKLGVTSRRQLSAALEL